MDTSEARYLVMRVLTKCDSVPKGFAVEVSGGPKVSGNQ